MTREVEQAKEEVDNWLLLCCPTWTYLKSAYKLPSCSSTQQFVCQSIQLLSILSRENVVICRGIVNFFFFFLLVRPRNNFQFFHTTPDSLMTRSQGLVIEKTYYHSMEEIKLLMLYIRFQNFCTETVSNFRLCSFTIPDSFCAGTTTGYTG